LAERRARIEAVASTGAAAPQAGIGVDERDPAGLLAAARTHDDFERLAASPEGSDQGDHRRQQRPLRSHREESMTGPAAAPDTHHPQDMLGQTAVVIGGSAGIGLETARLARAHGADVVLAARDPARLRDAADQVDARSTAAFDVTDLVRLEQFFEDLPGPIDHIMVTGPGPYYSSLADMDFDAARRDVGDRIVTTLAIARHGAARMRPPGTLLFVGGTGGRQAGVGMTLISAMTAATPALIASLAVELAPIRANLIAAGFVDTPLSASLLGDQLDARRAELRATLPIGRVVGPADVAALAVHIMTNTALTGATYDIDGGQQLLSNRGGSG
jgi:NAD(P)-dependent dehydrogenase (short-subunit alcohol dehydrogenase family)